ncbi:MAG: polysaccharide ABC transporter ATP-binding protein [Clostridia bacterium]|nr:polysaccharide ABC transporter ATP-binding protein [Clostridia bacterium]
MRETMIEIDNITKTYRLGTIGGGTLKGDIQSFWARLRHKDDPNLRIGEKGYKKNEKFTALDGVSFDVKKGETIGLIGRNGAGKSTLLKLLSRVTAPTEGEIRIKGKISSMLEVGTGFHPELTGRENVYLNGAILGMSRKEVDERIEDIIEFSECRQFIDTPVKRYSSGMFVKLAFSVAAHLNSDIMLMDEVLAVGDMAFQKKCIEKMVSVAKDEGKTIIYVSHNMQTIRQLCSRCVVLDKGKVIFNGDVEDAINVYLKNDEVTAKVFNDFTDCHKYDFLTDKVIMDSLEVLGKETCHFKDDEKIKFRLKFHANEDVEKLSFRMMVHNNDQMITATSVCYNFMSCKKGETYEPVFEMDVSTLSNGLYKVIPVLFEMDELGKVIDADGVYPGLLFEYEHTTPVLWRTRLYGDTVLPDMVCEI